MIFPYLLCSCVIKEDIHVYSELILAMMIFFLVLFGRMAMMILTVLFQSLTFFGICKIGTGCGHFFTLYYLHLP